MEKGGTMVKSSSMIILAVLFMAHFSCFAQTFSFKQVKTDDICLNQLMANITSVIHDGQWCCDAQCHVLSIKKFGTDTMLEIHSFDTYGIYNTLLNQELFGVCLLFNHEFYVDTSFAKSFYITDNTFKKKYNRKIVEEQSLSINDCYHYWLFKKNFCGIDLYKSWIMEDFKGWYNLELNPKCFCNYKKMSVELIEEEPEDIDIPHQ